MRTLWYSKLPVVVIQMGKSKDILPITEEIDFAYLLELMPLLSDSEEYSLLPELFSIIGYKRLLLLCKYAGGEQLRVPTIKELSDSIDALQHYYNIYIEHTESLNDVPERLVGLLNKVVEHINAKNDN